MRFDTIVVPRGAETRAVERGWPPPRPVTLIVPAGATAGRRLNDGRPALTALVLGLCGALDPALRVGDAVVYARIADGARTIDLDPRLAAACAAACARAPVDAAVVDRVVGDVAAKSALRLATGAAVIDMEAAAIARALHARGIRVAMVRVVSDDAHTDLPDLRHVYDAGGALRPSALALALLRAPRRGARFVRNAMHALSALRTTATRLAVSCAE